MRPINENIFKKRLYKRNTNLYSISQNFLFLLILYLLYLIEILNKDCNSKYEYIDDLVLY